ncbi:hypothetical protein BCAR13_120066 [Paraburkholderia caribensis]|jgi:hypothetical protein|nr:hypothetical protein BCAR13_120066 [Paraburkholderia caribensis]
MELNVSKGLEAAGAENALGVIAPPRHFRMFGSLIIELGKPDHLT